LTDRYKRLLREVRECTDALQDGGIILNSAHEIVWFNSAVTTLLGFDPVRDRGQRVDNLIRHPDFVTYQEDPQGEVVIPSPRDSERYLAIQLVPYGRGQSLAIIRDVTRQVRLERTRRDFIANASHELRSPLTVISGYLDALAEGGELPESWDGPITETQRQVERMTTILSDLIELTRLESSEDEAEYEFIDVRELLEPIYTEFSNRSKSPCLELQLDAELGLLGNESEVHSIFLNLINNAVRFTSEDGHIQIQWRRDDAAAVFLVVDTGIGIQEEHIPRITERFYRVDKGRSRETGGTGLGLAIVRHAVQRHNGHLSIESQIGKGSTFGCHFPETRVVSSRSPQKAVVN
jgi:two-component system phosphate regulon sensor histidine kinase PhoR